MFLSTDFLMKNGLEKLLRTSFISDLHIYVEAPVELTSPSENKFHWSAMYGSVVTKWIGIVCTNYSQYNFKGIILAP